MSSLLTGLVSYYALEGNGNDSLGVNDANTGSGAVYGLIYGKVNEGVLVNDPSTLDTTTTTGFPSGNGTRTVSYWLRTTTVNFMVWLEYGTEIATPNEDFAFIMDGSGLIGVGYGAGGGFFTSTVVNDGIYHFVVASYDGTTTTLYVDNVLVGTHIDVLNTIPTTLKFNRFQFSGEIDEVGIWDRVLTVSEINDLWNAGAGLTYPFAPPVSASNAGLLFNLL